MTENRLAYHLLPGGWHAAREEVRLTTLYLDPSMSDVRRRQTIFEGDLFLYSPSPASKRLIECARSMIQQAFAPNDPEHAQSAMAVSQFVAIVGPVKSQFTNSLVTKSLIRDLIVEYGCDPDATYFDVPRLRVVSHSGYLSAGVGYAYKAHRDMWYASPASQVNWWTPVFPIETDRSLAFYPTYWARPVGNSSDGFDYADWVNTGRAQAADQIQVDSRNHPLPKDHVDTANELRVVCPTAAMIAFSSNMLHATVDNTSGVTRFSIDFRTVNVEDIGASRGADNIDSRATGSTLGEFLRASDFTAFPVANNAKVG